MADGFSLGDNKKTDNITGDTGVSPLEQAISSSPSQVDPKISSANQSDTTLAYGGIRSDTNKAKIQQQTVEEKVPSVSSVSDTNLPPGVQQQSQPLGGNTNNVLSPKKAYSSEQPSAQKPSAYSQAYDNPPDVLHEKQNEPKQSPTEPSKPTDPAIIDALKSFEEEKANRDNPQLTQNQPQDLGEPAKTPDTDEFLKSILSDQDNSQEAEAAVGNDTAKPTGDYSQSEAADVPTETNPVMPTTSLNNKAPIDSQSGQEGQEKTTTGGVSIDSISGAEPQPADNDDMIKANQPKPKSSPIKIILAVVLAIAVVAVGYFVYKILFPPETQTDTSSYYDTLPQEVEYGSLQDEKTGGADIYATDDEQRKADLGKIKEALLDYYAGKGSFPVSENLILLTADNILEAELVPTFISFLPEDPNMSRSYGYKSNGASFTLTAVLDDATDPEITLQDGKAIYNLTYDPLSSNTSSSGSNIQEEAVEEPMPDDDINNILNY